ncbi:MAG: hypothetical protein D6B27_04325 [Gammaproteobacteria bacterium]|nr:MAG: hypothetical protein D6B27_04325 [Gammaproteobacteria bacterium]
MFKRFFILILAVGFLCACQESQEDSVSAMDNDQVVSEAVEEETAEMKTESAFFDSFEDNYCVESDEPVLGIADFHSQSAENSPFVGGDQVRVHIYLSSSDDISELNLSLGDVKLISQNVIGKDCEKIYEYDFPVTVGNYELMIYSDELNTDAIFDVSFEGETWMYIGILEQQVHFESQSEPYSFM